MDTPVNPPKAPDPGKPVTFKAGDKVRMIDNGSPHYGRDGTISSSNAQFKTCSVRLDGDIADITLRCDQLAKPGEHDDSPHMQAAHKNVSRTVHDASRPGGSGPQA